MVYCFSLTKAFDFVCFNEVEEKREEKRSLLPFVWGRRWARRYSEAQWWRGPLDGLDASFTRVTGTFLSHSWFDDVDWKPPLRFTSFFFSFAFTVCCLERFSLLLTCCLELLLWDCWAFCLWWSSLLRPLNCLECFFYLSCFDCLLFLEGILFLAQWRA